MKKVGYECMKFVKCPRCELNYMQEGERYCDICKKELKGEIDHDDMEELCIECGERPAMKSSELCLLCLREHQRREGFEGVAEVKVSDVDDALVVPDVQDLEDLELDVEEEEVLPPELDEIDKELADEPSEAEPVLGMEIDIDELIREEEEAEDDDDDDNL